MVKDLDVLKIFYYLNNKGGLIVMFFGKDDMKYCMLIVYVDMFGVMVKEIKVDGWLFLILIGGYCFNVIEGEYCIIEISDGDLYSGIILMY